jgi:hypothetical protein
MCDATRDAMCAINSDCRVCFIKELMLQVDLLCKSWTGRSGFEEMGLQAICLNFLV